MIRTFLFLVPLCVGNAIAAESRPIPLRTTERQFQEFIASLKYAARKKDATAIYALLAPDYYIHRDYGGSFDPSATPVRNFSASFQFDNDNPDPKYKDYGWTEFRGAISGTNFERKRNGEVCTPHGALDKKPFPDSQLCFRKLRDGWRIQGYINDGD